MATSAATPDDDKSKLDKIDGTLLSCSICLEQYKNPKILPCNHTFCQQCLETLVAKNKGVLNCPVCSTPCPLPNGVSGLKASFVINSLIDIVKQGPVEDSKPGLCEACEENTASNRCVDCSLNFCPFCTKTHTIIPSTRGHKVITLDEYKQSTPAIRLSHNKVYCTIHPENVVKFFCDTCQVAVCLECTVVEHRIPEHVHITLQEAVDTYAIQLQELAANVKEKEKEAKICRQEAEQTRDELKQQRLVEKNKVTEKANDTINGAKMKAERNKQPANKKEEQAIQKAKKKAEEIIAKAERERDESIRNAEKERKETIRKVDRERDETIQNAEREEQRLIEELETEYSARIKQAEAELDDLEMKHGNISSTCSYLETLMHHGSPARLMSTMQETIASAKQMVAIETEYTKPNFLRFEPADEKAEHGMLGLLGFDVCVPKCTVETIPKHVMKGDSINLVIRTKDSQGKQVAPYQEVRVKVKNPSGSEEDIQVKDNRDGTHAVTITTHEVGKMAVTATVAGQPIPGSPTHIIAKRMKKIGKQGSGEGEFNSPRRTVLSKHGDYFTADTDNNRIVRTDQDGNFKSSFTFTGPQFKQPFNPMDIAMSADDTLYMTDGNNKQVAVSDVNGHLIQCFGQKELKYPRGIAVSPVDGSIYVTDWNGYWNTDKGDHKVVKYTQDGKFIHSFGKYGTKRGEFQGPSSVAVNGQGLAFISDYGNHYIHVYNASNQFLHRIGRSGNFYSELCGPTCLDTDRDGHVYVCESHPNTNRVQKFDISGRFICRIDSKEDGLSYPEGVTVLSSGSTCRLAVADTDNHCIKIFAD